MPDRRCHQYNQARKRQSVLLLIGDRQSPPIKIKTMFELVNESTAKKYHDAIAYKMASSYRGLIDECTAAKEIEEAKETLFDIYTTSLVELSKAIERLQPGISSPQWYTTAECRPENMMIECRIDESKKRYYLASYKSYLNCVNRIKKEYNFDESMKTYLEKEQEWSDGDRLKERLRSYAKLSAFN